MRAAEISDSLITESTVANYATIGASSLVVISIAK